MPMPPLPPDPSMMPPPPPGMDPSMMPPPGMDPSMMGAPPPMGPEEMLGATMPPPPPLTHSWVPYMDGKPSDVNQDVCGEIGGVPYVGKDKKKFCLVATPDGGPVMEPPGSKPL